MAAAKESARRRRKPRLVLLFAAFTSALLLLGALLTFVVYRFVVEPFYIRLLQNELSELQEEILRADFDEHYLRRLRTDIRVFVFDKQRDEVTYIDSYFHGDPLPDAIANATPPERPEGDREVEDVQEVEAAVLLERAVRYTLGDTDGFYFAADDWGKAPNGIPLNSKALYLNGQYGGKYYSLCLPVESVSTTLTLGLRFSGIILLLIWVIAMLAIWLFYRRLTSSSTAILQAADRMAKLDFSSRCPPGITREFDEFSRSSNALSGQLEQHISELETSSARLSEELEESARQHRLTRDLIANLSHDLKTPIAIISGYAEGLTEGVAKTPEQRERYARMILQESTRMQCTVKKMLELSRLEAGNTALEFRTFDLSELVGDALSGFQIEMEKSGIEAEIRLETPLEVCSDVNSIRQVVVNYVQNAVYHINGGNRIRAVTERQGNTAVFRIANSSVPILGEFAKNIWDKLYRGDTARSRDHGETGLGLCIVRGNMEHLGQGYGFRNLEDEGMVEFYIELPVAASQCRSADEPVT